MDSFPVVNVVALCNFIVDFDLLIGFKSEDDFFDELGILFELWMCLLGWIGHGDDGVEYFGVEKDGMVTLIIPTLFPETHDLSQLFLCVVLCVLDDFEFLSHFFL